MVRLVGGNQLPVHPSSMRFYVVASWTWVITSSDFRLTVCGGNAQLGAIKAQSLCELALFVM